MSVYTVYECDLCHTKCQDEPKRWRQITVTAEALRTDLEPAIAQKTSAMICPRCAVQLQLSEQPDAGKLLAWAASYFQPREVGA